MKDSMYDQFSADYDHFVNWESRLAAELPFLEKILRPLAASRPISVLDAACGTGMHAVALAQRGFAAAGADLSPQMAARGRDHALNAGVSVDFKAAGFGELAIAFHNHPLFPFDAVICLGNSLPHLLSPVDLAAALADFADCLRPGGLLVIQNRNFDAVMQTLERWMEPQSYRSDSREWTFLRFYDYDPDGLITFNVINLYREDEHANWQQRIHSTRLAPQREQDLRARLMTAGFHAIQTFGGLSGSDFDPGSSGNLVLVAQKN
jgi:glycine/sarcosine N-methyltransferase